MIKRYQIVKSLLEPDKNVLWLNKDNELKIYNNRAWVHIESKPLPIATESTLGAIKVGYINNEYKYKVELDEEGNAFVHVPYIEPEILNITYNKLITLRATSLLIPGKQYRIIDYTASTTQEGTYALNNCVFDIIVTADSKNTLNENARAAYPLLMDRLGSFNELCHFEKWELKYSIDNGLGTHYAWGDPSGKGLIYYLKDEHNNVCHFDWKNILIDSTYLNYGEYLPNVGYMYLFDVNLGAIDLSMMGLIKNANIENYTPIGELVEYIPLLVFADLMEIISAGIPISKINIENSNNICIMYSSFINGTLYNDFLLIYNNYGINPIFINIKDSYSILLKNVFGDINIYKSEALDVGLNGIPYYGSELTYYKVISSTIHMSMENEENCNIYDITGCINEHIIRINNSNLIALRNLNSCNNITISNCYNTVYINENIINNNNIILKNIIDPNGPINTYWLLQENDLSIKDIVFTIDSNNDIKSYYIDDILINLKN